MGFQQRCVRPLLSDLSSTADPLKAIIGGIDAGLSLLSWIWISVL